MPTNVTSLSRGAASVALRFSCGCAVVDDCDDWDWDAVCDGCDDVDCDPLRGCGDDCDDCCVESHKFVNFGLALALFRAVAVAVAFAFASTVAAVVIVGAAFAGAAKEE